MKNFILFVFLFVSFFKTEAKIWEVGENLSYKSPSSVTSLAQNNDTVYIHKGVYLQDVCKWTANNLLLKGVDERPILNSNGISSGGKAIWVISGNNVRVENIEFLNCRVPDKNGAGIRVEGVNISIIKCGFHNNEMGILAGDKVGSRITIEQCEFGYNGYGDGYSHNVYINHVDELIFRFNYSHHSKTGHELKSRAHINRIYYNRLSDENDGTASRNIDLPNGGLAYVIGNIIEQGPISENSNLIGYGLEGLTNNEPHELIVVNNTFINNKGTGNYFQLKFGTIHFECINNILAGGGNFFGADLPALLDSSNNIISKDINSLQFSNSIKFNFSLLQSSPANQKGRNLKDTLTKPEFEYVHPSKFVKRNIIDFVSIGAYEVSSTTSFIEINLIQNLFLQIR